MSELSITIGNKNYSSWSLRGWMAVKLTGAEFEEVLIPLDQPETHAAILARSPSGLVPALHHDGLVIHDSLAIAEYLAELFPDAGLWPEARGARAMARAVTAEMHAGFTSLRAQLSMDMRRQRSKEISPAVRADITRITEIWESCRRDYGAGGDYLFGKSYCVADAFYAPVVSRFRTYGVTLEGAAKAYAEAAWAFPALQEWYAAARAEPWDLGDDH